MKLGLLILLSFSVLTLSGCLVEPYGYRHEGYHGDRDYGRRVWRE